MNFIESILFQSLTDSDILVLYLPLDRIFEISRKVVPIFGYILYQISSSRVLKSLIFILMQNFVFSHSGQPVPVVLAGS